MGCAPLKHHPLSPAYKITNRADITSDNFVVSTSFGAISMKLLNHRIYRGVSP